MVEHIEEATHWLAKENNAKAQVKKNTAYKLFVMLDSFFDQKIRAMLLWFLRTFLHNLNEENCIDLYNRGSARRNR